MKDFMENWKTDSRFRTKVKLGLYTLFVAIVAIFAFSTRNNVSIDNLQDDNNSNTNEKNTPITIPQKYNYIINITINENSYQYTGTKESTKESITKMSNGIVTNYRYENENYYKEENGIYVVTAKEEIYDIVNYNYLKLETINQYLSKATNSNNQYLVYLKDIILGNDSKEYITITKNDNNINNLSKINIDYTSLMKLFDNTIENYLIEIKIEGIE